MAKILFIQEDEWPKLGIMYLAGTLKKHGHEVDLVIGSEFKDIEPSLSSSQPDVVGFSIMTGDHHWAANMANKVKAEFDVTTLFGGPHVTFFPDFVHEECVDAIIRGDGELALLGFMDCIEGKQELSHVKNLWYKKDGEVFENEMGELEDIDSVPFPDRTVYRKYEDRMDFSVLYMLTTRGCPYKCTFCFEEELQNIYQGLGQYVRVRSPQNIFAEIKDALDQGVSFDHVMFLDDVFGINKTWLYDFLEKYKKEIDLPYICLVRADLVHKGDDYAKRLADAGCVSVAFGIESGTERLRQLSLQKQLTDQQIIEATKELHDAGIKVKTYNLFGFPGETIEDAFSTVEINMKIKADFPQSNLFIPFPKTGLAEYAMENGYLKKDFDVDDIRNDTFIHSILKSPYTKEFERINKFFQTAVMFPFLWPLIKRYCISNIHNPILQRLEDLWFSFVYFLIYWKSSKRSIFRLVPYGIKNLRKFLGLLPPPSPGDSRRRVRKMNSSEEESLAHRKLRRKKWLKRVQDTDNVRANLQENSEPVSHSRETVEY
jgi:anaerobic magnesium-protoporphyrin IX monomethyl ester cyclase